MKSINYILINLILINSNLLFSMNSNSSWRQLTQEEINENKEKERLGNLLLEAAQIGDLETIRKLISKQVNLNFRDKDSYYTAIMKAILHCHLDAVKLLIEAGADINKKTFQFQYTALLIIVNKINHILSQALCDSNAEKEIKILKLLLNSNVQINEKNYEDESALGMAIRYDNIEIAELLIDAGADLNLMIGNGTWALKTTYQYAFKLNRPKIQNLIKNKIQEYKTNIYKAIEQNNLQDFKKNLLKVGSICFKDQNKNNVLHIAAKFNKPEMFKLILSVRPDLISEKNNDNKIPLELNPGIIKYLYNI